MLNYYKQYITNVRNIGGLMNKEEINLLLETIDTFSKDLVIEDTKVTTLCFNNKEGNLLNNYIKDLQHQLEEKNKIIEEKNKCLLEIAKEEINFINYLKSKGINFDNENWVNELEEILERGKNEN